MSGPQVAAVTVGCVAAGRSFAGSDPCGDEWRPSGTSLAPLDLVFQQRMQRISRNVAAVLPWALGELAAWQRRAGLDTSSGQQVKQARRTRKKKRKKKLPRGALPRCARHVRGDPSVSRLCLLGELTDNANLHALFALEICRLLRAPCLWHSLVRCLGVA